MNTKTRPCEGFKTTPDGRNLRTPGCTSHGTHGPVRGRYCCQYCFPMVEKQKEELRPYAATG